MLSLYEKKLVEPGEKMGVEGGISASERLNKYLSVSEIKLFPLPVEGIF
jgi:hypothetical protein